MRQLGDGALCPILWYSVGWGEKDVAARYGEGHLFFHNRAGFLETNCKENTKLIAERSSLSIF